MTADEIPSPPAEPPKNLLEALPCALPVVDLKDDASSVQSAIESCKEMLNLQRLNESDFAPGAIWRDTYALTGTFRTFYSPSSISKAWLERTKVRDARNFSIVSNSPALRVERLSKDNAWVDVPFTFETEAEPRTTCSGVISLIPGVEGTWNIWMLRTVLEQMQNCPNVDQLVPTNSSASNGALSNGRHTDGSDTGHNSLKEPQYFQCVVVGGGQGGLGMAGRLKALGLSYIVIDKQPHVGDSWNSRYDSVKLHTTRQYAHLPFERTFSSDYHEYLTKGELARGYQNWVKKYSINVWTSTELKSGSWDQNEKLWTLKILNSDSNEEQTISASYVIMANGGGGHTPQMPKYQDQDNFRGSIIHSHHYRSANAWKGLHGVVVGAANTAHDVAEDMVAANMKSVTMIQRNRTYVLPGEHWKRVADASFNDQIPTDFADRALLSMPLGVARLFFMAILGQMASEEPERFEALEKAGFKTEVYGDLAYNLFQRMGAHHMDVGCSQKIVDGLIKMKSDALPQRFTPDGIEFTDGTHIPADVVIFATGFAGNMRTIVREMFGEEIASQVSDYWGLDNEGEIKGAYRPTGHPGLWYVGGPLGHCRYFSRHVAMHIKADVLGTPFEVYDKTP